MNSTQIQLSVLGPTKLIGPEGPVSDGILKQPKRLALLVYLAIETLDGFRRRDVIAPLFWPELDQAQARTYLRKTLHSIRESVKCDVVLTRGDEVRIDPEVVWCDATALMRLSDAGQWREALELYRGELLDGLFPEAVAQEFEEWLSRQRNALRKQAANAAWQASRVAENEGDPANATALAFRARQLDPDNEEGVRHLLSLLDRRGDRSAALRHYSEWQARMLEEYGVEPAPETRKLALRIQAARKGESHDTSPASVPAGRTPPASSESVSAQSHSIGRRSWRRAGFYAVVIVAAATLLSVGWKRNAATPSNAIAVLPFRSSGDSIASPVAAMLTDNLTTALAMDRSLSVRATSRAKQAWAEPGDFDRLGSRLRVAYVVEGRVQAAPGRWRTNLHLLRTGDAVVVWAGSFETSGAEDSHSVLLTVAREISQVIRPQ